MGLIEFPGRVRARRLMFNGHDLRALSDNKRRRIAGKDMAMVFQDPLASLNPCFTVAYQLAETLRVHGTHEERHNATRRRARALELLAEVEIPDPAARLDAFPHQLSGGMAQRVMIAMAIACRPKLLIADEPTTALDVTIQAQILDLLAELKSRLGMAVMLITHAMGVVAETAQRVVVMYAGQVIEEAPVRELFAHPRHPYTQGLIRSIPRIDLAATHKTRLEAIAGTVPKLIAPKPGCRFAPRCKFAVAECTSATPPLREVAPGHKVACILDVVAQ
jgi:peptide/nickel transport system ATP-binding protein